MGLSREGAAWPIPEERPVEIEGFCRISIAPNRSLCLLEAIIGGVTVQSKAVNGQTRKKHRRYAETWKDPPPEKACGAPHQGLRILEFYSVHGRPLSRWLAFRQKA